MPPCDCLLIFRNLKIPLCLGFLLLWNLSRACNNLERNSASISKRLVPPIRPKFGNFGWRLWPSAALHELNAREMKSWLLSRSVLHPWCRTCWNFSAFWPLADFSWRRVTPCGRAYSTAFMNIHRDSSAAHYSTAENVSAGEDISAASKEIQISRRESNAAQLLLCSSSLAPALKVVGLTGSIVFFIFCKAGIFYFNSLLHKEYKECIDVIPQIKNRLYQKYFMVT